MQELVERDVSVAVRVQGDADLEHVVHVLGSVKLGQLQDEVADLHRLGLLVRDVCEDVEDRLASVYNDVLKDLLQEGYGLPNTFGDFVVLVSELNLLEH